jgi:integrase
MVKIMREFTSAFAGRIRDFILQKNALGYPYESGTHHLWHFDKMCQNQFPGETQLTRDICMVWAVRRDGEGNGFPGRLSAVREFARYLTSIGEIAHVLPSDFTKKGARRSPRIYTEAEIASMWEAADTIEQKRADSTIRRMVIPVFLRLLYCCGLRPAEVIKLRVENVDLERGRLYIAESKGHNDRYVWMTDDVTELCRSYNSKIEGTMPERAFFFPSIHNKQCSKTWLLEIFREVLAKAGIVQLGQHPPRIYDFRHTFATHRLYRWMKEGKDLSAMLPYLSAYMGHAHISDTYYYIHLVPGMMETMSGVDCGTFSDLLPEVEADE